MKNNLISLEELDSLKSDPVSIKIDEVFRPITMKSNSLLGELKNMSNQPNSVPNELELEETDLPEIDLLSEESPPDMTLTQLDEGIELSLIDDSLDLSDGSESEESENNQDEDLYGDIELGEELNLLSDDGPIENLGELSFDETPATQTAVEASLDDAFELGDLSSEKLLEENDIDLVNNEDQGLSLIEGSLDSGLDVDALSLGNDESGLLGLVDNGEDADLSEDAKEKLKEIDAIMDYDASQINIKHELGAIDQIEDEMLLGDFSLGEVSSSLPIEKLPEKLPEKIAAPKSVAKKVEMPETSPAPRVANQEIKEISVAYNGEMERMQATISNLRSDREELLNKIQKLEEGGILQSRQNLNLRAELDEKKIELIIIRKKLNEEISELKDRVKIFDEKKLILDEKNKILMQELDKSSQKNKIDIKKVQMREKELEQKLELLKSDAESQIRHRDLKILELKRKIDAMEFDMESISTQEKRSIESRFELEDKLEKAIKTLRSAITVLEDESDHSNALNTLKKNINM